MRDPEVLMVALVVVSAKLRFPFATSQTEDNGSKIMDWSRWRTTKRAKSGEGQRHLASGGEYKVTANDVLTMNSVKLDDYMDWFEGMWLGEENSGSTYSCFHPNHLCQRPDLERAPS